MAALEVAAISETVDLEKAIIFVVARYVSRQMKSRCKTLHIDLVARDARSSGKGEK